MEKCKYMYFPIKTYYTKPQEKMYLNFIFSRGSLSLRKYTCPTHNNKKEYTMIPIILLAEMYQFTFLNSYQLSDNQIYAWIFNYWENMIYRKLFFPIFSIIQHNYTSVSFSIEK